VIFCKLLEIRPTRVDVDVVVATQRSVSMSDASERSSDASSVRDQGDRIRQKSGDFQSRSGQNLTCSGSRVGELPEAFRSTKVHISKVLMTSETSWAVVATEIVRSFRVTLARAPTKEPIRERDERRKLALLFTQQ